MTVTATATKIWDAESTSNWTLNKGDVYSGWQREGTYCIGDQVSQTSYTEIYDYYSANGSYLNISGKFVTFWVLLWGSPNTTANAGVGYYLEDSAGNAVYLHLGGSDKGGMYYGAFGWQCFSFYADSTYLQNNVTYTQVSGSSFPDLTNLEKVGVHFNITSKAVGTSPNVMFDVCYALDYVTITGGSASTPLTFADIVSADDTNAWGIISEIETGTYFVQGKFRFGDTTNDTYFVDKGKLIIFKDTWVPDNFHEFDIYRGSANTTVFQMGEKSGSAGINGCVVRAPSNKRFVFDAYTNYDTTNMSQGDIGLYGTSYYYMGQGKLPNSSYGEVLTCNFINSGMLYAYQTTIEGTNFIGSSDRALWIPTNHNVSESNFISNNVAVYLDTTGDYTFDALIFTGNTYDIENATSGTINIYATNGSNPSTVYNSGGGTTNIINSVYVTVYVKDRDLNPIQNARVYVLNVDDNDVIMNDYTDSNGKAETTYNYTTDKNLEIRVRKSSPDEGTRYIPVRTYGTLTSTGFSTTIVMYEDLVAT